MKPINWIMVHFSPTGTTKKVACAIASGLGEGVSEMDLCKENCLTAPDDSTGILVVMPVYAGRVPGVALERLTRIQGNGQPAVAVVVYGNREFDDALLELKNTLEHIGFQVAAAGAFIAEHSIVRSIAAGRPDETDLNIARQFGMDIMEKLENENASIPVQVSGNFPYIEAKPSAFHPKADEEKCIRCGTCAAMCPAAAIPDENPDRTLDSKCITCMRCVQVCPVNARALPAAFIAGAAKMLTEKAAGYKSPQLYL